MPSKKIVGLGGGSLYFSRVLADLPLDPGLAGSEIVLYDLDGEKAARMAKMGQKLADMAGTGFRVRATAHLAEALDGADFGLSAIGGSGAEVTPNVYGSYFHNADIRIPARYGIPQIVGDTCGPAGMMMGLRAIPAYMQICRAIEKHAPRMILLNHSNPMAVLMRAIHKYTRVHAYGICHGVQAGIIHASKLLNLPADDFECIWIGTNHYYWFTRVLYQGRDITRKLLRATQDNPCPAGHALSRDLSLAYGHRIVYASDDHVIEFYPFIPQFGSVNRLPTAMRKVAKQHATAPHAKPPTATGASKKVRADFMKNYQKLLDKTQLPKEQETGFRGEGIASLISAIANRRRQPAIVNVANCGAIPNLPATAEVEVEGITDSAGVRSMVMGDCPPVLKGILEKRFVWQELVADAGVTGDRNKLFQALLVDEMALWPEKTKAMMDELLHASKDMLPKFFPAKGRRG